MTPFGWQKFWSKRHEKTAKFHLTAKKNFSQLKLTKNSRIKDIRVHKKCSSKNENICPPQGLIP